LNAACALLIAGKVEELKAGVALARDSIDSGAALRAVEKLAQVSPVKG
jgi:anthranilate phosphoribosyltransferase